MTVLVLVLIMLLMMHVWLQARAGIVLDYYYGGCKGSSCQC